MKLSEIAESYMQAHRHNNHMNEIHSEIFHICKTNIDIVEFEFLNFIKIAVLIYFFIRMCLGLIEYFVNP